MTDLEIITTKDLIDELMKRFEHCVVGGIRTKVHTSDDIVTVRRFHGNLTLCSGLCSELQYDILAQHKRREKQIGDF